MGRRGYRYDAGEIRRNIVRADSVLGDVKARWHSVYADERT